MEHTITLTDGEMFLLELAITLAISQYKKELEKSHMSADEVAQMELLVTETKVLHDKLYEIKIV